ncbi:hypothetical protein [Nocardia brasiliensis]|uniref:VG15 protein n=1 Tax=Nocardia brasiliensis TaxID=37326 RepID=UPI0024574163|nr:hypothetical protein [Nocardia brasiliensis]
MTPGAYRLALDAIMLELGLVVRPLVRLFLADPTPQARATLVDLLTPHIVHARQRSYEAAVEFLSAQRAAQGVSGAPVIPKIRPYEPAYVDRAVVNVLANYPREPEGALVATAVKHAEQAARAVPRDSAELFNAGASPADNPVRLHLVRDEPATETADDGDDEYEADEDQDDYEDETDDNEAEDEDQADEQDDETDEEGAQGWARMLTGRDNCAFCVVLSSRGAVYSSKEAAIEGANGDEYHVGCDCVAVAVFDRDTWPGWKDARRLDALYRQATKAHPNTNGINAVRRLLAQRSDALVADMRSAA